MKITVEATAKATRQACWDAAVSPQAIKAWNAASPDWHCPSAEVDLRPGGRMVSRMEAKDGSMGFDFAATFTTVEPPRRLAYTLDDARQVELTFEDAEGAVRIRQTFDAETENDPDVQRQGWQSILDSFVRYVEA